MNLKDSENFPYELISSDDAIVITAAISAPDTCTNDYQNAWAINVLGTIKFISSAIERGGRVIFFSSDAVYGEIGGICNESSIASPLGDYASMKHEVERKFDGDPLFKSVRLSFVFSRDDKFTKYLLACSKEKIEAEIFHPFDRSIVYRQDVIDGILALIEKWSEYPQSIINFGGPELISRIQFVETLNECTQLNINFSVVESPREFFLSRPRSIEVYSPFFKSLLGRLPRNLEEAMRNEFSLDKVDTNSKLLEGNNK